jgi:hypothetical protein
MTPGLSSSDERHGSVTVRRISEDGRLVRAHIFNSSGWRDTTVTTERGIRDAVDRLNARTEESDAS